MSKLEKLIEKHCPNGVEFRTLGELCEIYTGSQLNKTAMFESGKYPVLNGGTSFSGRYDEYNTEANTIAVSQGGASAGFVNYITEPFWAGAHCFIVNPISNDILKKYIFFFLKNCQAQIMKAKLGAGIPGLNRKELFEISVPVPPLPVQEEIVRILDSYTELEVKLEIDLAAELEARRKQYEYYRNELLTFDKLGGGGRVDKAPFLRNLFDKYCPNGVEYRTLGEIIYYPKERISASKLKADNYVGVENLLKDKKGKVDSVCVPTEGNLIEYIIGDLLIGNIRPYLKKIWLATNNGGTNGDILLIRRTESYKTKIATKFLYYLLSSDSFFQYANQHSKGAKMPRGDRNMISNYSVPVPPLPVQEEIVRILDRFDALVNDISIGLPAELSARRKQYEYYRNRLLTFERR